MKFESPQGKAVIILNSDKDADGNTFLIAEIKTTPASSDEFSRVINCNSYQNHLTIEDISLALKGVIDIRGE